MAKEAGICSLGSDFESISLATNSILSLGCLTQGRFATAFVPALSFLYVSTHELRFCMVICSTFLIICICLNAPLLKIYRVCDIGSFTSYVSVSLTTIIHLINECCLLFNQCVMLK